MTETSPPPSAEEIEALAERRRQEQAAEYGQFVAAQDIYHDGALAYVKGAAVPASNVRRLGYFVNGLVVTAEQAAAARDAAAKATNAQSAAEAELIAAHDAAIAEAAKPTAPFDPAEHTVDEVNDYLAVADAEETARVLAAEAADKARVGILTGPNAEPEGLPDATTTEEEEG